MSRDRTLAAAEKQLAAMLAAPVVNLVQASLMAQLIMSVRSLPMTAEENIINSEMTVHALLSNVDALNSLFDDPNTRDALMADFDFIEQAQDRLTLLMAKIQNAKERRMAKAYGDAFKHLFQQAAE